MLVPGSCIKGFRLEEQVGASAVAHHWRAIDLRRGSIRGLRVLAPEAREHAAAFVAAAERQRGLNHPNRVRLLEVIDLEGTPAAVTEHISGPSLATWMRIRNRSLDEILAVFQDVVSGVASSHELELWHLHFDPTQIWMHTRRGSFVPKVDLAFGPMIAGGLRLGPHRPPELVLGQPVDARSDLWLLGAMFSELLGGRPPAVEGRPWRSLADARSDLPRGLVHFVDRLLAVSSKDRPRSIDELAATLAKTTEALGDAAGSTWEDRPARSIPVVAIRPWSHPVALASMALVAVTLVGALFVSLGG